MAAQIGVSTTTATIGNGTSLSAGIALGAARLARIDMPAAWDTANLTFQISPDGGTTWNEFYDASGNEYIVTAAAGRSILIPLADFLGIIMLKVRSGTSGSAVNQTADRILTLTLVM